MGTLTTTVRFSKPTIGGDTGPIWPNEINSDWDYADQAINQRISVAVPDANVVLVADGGSSDQARYLTYVFTGALTANRTVTLPANAKTGWAINNTTGSHNIVLSAGGTTAALLPDARAWMFYCDGTNVSFIPGAFGSLKAPGFSTDSSGNALFNTTASNPITANVPGVSIPIGSNVILNSNITPLSVGFMGAGTLVNWFAGPVSFIGSVSTDGFSTAYNTTSDERLKISDGVVPAAWAQDIVDNLSPRFFRWKSNPDEQHQPGFFAQEVAAIFPWAVNQGSGEPGDEDFQPHQMDASRLVPVLVAVLQKVMLDLRHQRGEMQTLRYRIAQLEGG